MCLEGVRFGRFDKDTRTSAVCCVVAVAVAVAWLLREHGIDVPRVSLSVSLCIFVLAHVLPSFCLTLQQTSLNVLLSEEETDLILQTAKDCIDSECSVDDVDGLIYELKNTEKELEDRLAKIMNAISHLQHLNEKDERKTDEVRQLVSDILRMFSFGVSRSIHLFFKLWH